MVKEILENGLRFFDFKYLILKLTDPAKTRLGPRRDLTKTWPDLPGTPSRPN